MYENNDGIRSGLSFLLMMSPPRGAFHQKQIVRGFDKFCATQGHPVK